MSNIVRPIARKNNLVVQELNDEVLVYDLKSNKAHCLNESAAAVWKNCDGVKSIEDICTIFNANSKAGVNEDFVWLAIDQLNELQLLEEGIAAHSKGQSRREVLKKVGLAAIIALPLVSTLVAPPSVMAGSLCNTGATCTVGGGECNMACVGGCSATPGNPGVCS